MTERVSLMHRTRYRYGDPVHLGPHFVRLTPSPRARTPIWNHTLNVTPADHRRHRQHDAEGNTVTRLTFSTPSRTLDVTASLTADLTPINAFDFLIDIEAATWPFPYPTTTAAALAPYLVVAPPTSELLELVKPFADRTGTATVDLVCDLARHVAAVITYRRRDEHGVQSPCETLTLRSGSCRDSAWLLIDLLRRLGIAARFVSGYLVQLGTDPADDHVELHAWAECFLPGAGWIGLDATSGFLTAEGHIPLAAAADYRDAAPIEGTHSAADVAISIEMRIARLTPAASIDDTGWQRLLAAGDAVDMRLAAADVRLTMGGEPTFVAADDPDAAEWNLAALGPTKAHYADRLARRLHGRFAPGGMIHHGHGKWYPGEPTARWAYAVVWRTDGAPLWRDPARIADEDTANAPLADAAVFARSLCDALGLDPDAGLPVFEDPVAHVAEEAKLPPDVTHDAMRAATSSDRARLARVLDHPLGAPVGVVVPITSNPSDRGPRFVSARWATRRAHLFLVPGDGPIGLRLPLASLPTDVAIRSALTISPRAGHVVIFLPPLDDGAAYTALLTAIETVAEGLETRVRLEGYLPPDDPALRTIKVTPDPGVIEVNVHPASSWRETVAVTTGVYEDAVAIGLTAEKFRPDGTHTSTGGGNHIVVGGAVPDDSPFLRRPDLLASIVAYWQAHPSLSFAFAGRFIGPTSQSPRIDEGRHDALAEIELAFAQLPDPGAPISPDLVDKLFRHLLTDVTGNTHRAEICIDKLASPVGVMGNLGLVEFRAIEMSPDPRQAAAIQLLIRALIAMLWERPFRRRLIRWGAHLHDRFMLPSILEADFADVLSELDAANLRLDPLWYQPHLAFRFPTLGHLRHGDVDVTLRQAHEPWHVLGDGPGAGTSRPVDSSTDRLEIRISGDHARRYTVACNGRVIPLTEIASQSERIAGVRYRVWPSPQGFHPLVAPHAPLKFDLVDTVVGHSVAAARYQPVLDASTRPATSTEATARRSTRVSRIDPSAPGMLFAPVAPRYEHPMTLDLRWPHGRPA